MRRISTAVLTAVLVTGMGVTLAPPALAKKKEEAKPAGPQVSQAVGVAVEKAKAAAAAKDNVALEAAVVEIETNAKTDYEKYLAVYLRYLLISDKIAAASTGTNGAADPTPMIAPLDALIANPATPADKLPQFEYSRAAIAFDQNNWALATRLFTSAKAHGSTETDIPLRLLKTQIKSGNPAAGLAELDTLYTSGKPMSDDLIAFAINESSKAKLPAETVKWLQRRMATVPTAKIWYNSIAFYGFSAQPVVKVDKRQKIDLYRLLRQARAIPDQQSYEEYAQFLFDIGLPDETKAVIEEGKAAGKIPAVPGLAIKKLMTDSVTAIAGDGSLEGREGKAAAAPTGPLSVQTADAYLARANYAKAAALYRQALTKGGVNADEVNTHLGIALALSGDKAGARTAFGAVTGAPRKDIAGFWTVWLDHPPTS